MGDVKIGLGQLNKPAPLNYRKFMNLYIIGIAPVISSFILGWGFSSNIQTHLLFLLGLSVSLIKGLGMVLGNGQIYSPSNQTIENQNKS